MNVKTTTLSTQVINLKCSRCNDELAIVGCQQCASKVDGNAMTAGVLITHRVYVVCANSDCGKIEAAQDEHTISTAIQLALKRYRANV